MTATTGEDISLFDIEDAKKKILDTQKLSKEDTENSKKEYYVQKYSSGIPLTEAVIVNGLPFFLQIADGKPALYQKIDLPDMILKPIDRISYLNKEYSFNSLHEINQYVQRASDETFDSLFQKLKAVWRKYIDANDDHITICASNTIFTYFQDKLGMTHYLLFVGDNNTGKSNNLVVLQYLGYRPLFDTSVTAANIYQFFGGIEEGQGIILEDEADNIDRNDEKMRIYKVGYKSGTKVSRIDTSFGRKQQSYWTYSFKAFSAEKQPDNNRAKGFNERVFVIPCSTGNPKYDITEVINPAGDSKYSQLLAELVDIRKLFLIFRLLNYNKPIPDIELNIKNRDKQLCKPLIRLFQDSTAVKEITGTLSKLLSEKKQRKGNTFEARLYVILKDLVKSIGTKLENKIIWTSVREGIEGSDITNRPQSYDTEEFGIISKKKVTGILVDRFGAEEKSDGSNRYLLINEETLGRLSANYDCNKIQILRPGNNRENPTYTFDTFYTSTDNTPCFENGQDKELAKFQQSNTKKIEESVINNKEIIFDNDMKTAGHFIKVSEVSEVSANSSEVFIEDLSPDSLANGSDSAVQYLKCPHCSFQNIYQDAIAHHIKFTHNNRGNKQ